MLGAAVGAAVGAVVGAVDGATVGESVGVPVGKGVGARLSYLKGEMFELRTRDFLLHSGKYHHAPRDRVVTI